MYLYLNLLASLDYLLEAIKKNVKIGIVIIEINVVVKTIFEAII